MSKLSRIPVFRGDTDDDASIHLHGRVGPGKPITYDHQLLNILDNSTINTDDVDFESQARDYNSEFEIFAERSSPQSDTEDDSTYVEDIPKVEHTSNFLQRTPTSKPSVPRSERQYSASKKRMKSNVSNISPTGQRGSKANNTNNEPFVLRYLFNFYNLGYIIGIVLFFFVLSKLSFYRAQGNLLNLNVVNERIHEVSQRIGALNEISQALDQQVDHISARQETLSNSVQLKISTLEDQLRELRVCAVDTTRLQRVEQDIEIFKTRLESGLLLITENPGEIEQKVNQISRDLAQLLKLKNDILSAKTHVVEELLERLPEVVPVYLKDNKIHYLPEFHDFLVSYVTSAGNSSLTWNAFMNLHGSQLKSYIDELIGNSGIKFLSKAQFEESLHERLSSNNRALIAKVNSMLDKIDLLSNGTLIDLSTCGNNVVLDNLLDVVGKGSVKVNFADYKLGSRILGFLTTTGIDSYKKKSLVRTIFLGWYDYLTSSGLRSPSNMKFNANNVLVDGGQYWQCEGKKCAVGIRLSSPVILTDIILNNPISGRPEGLEVPEMVSIYIKPRTKREAARLEQHLEVRLDFSYLRVDSRFLSKFYKVQEVMLKPSVSMQHIKLPTSIINMRIATRDLYVEITSRLGYTGLYNLKAYGISEFNSLRFAENFESILDHLSNDEGSNYQNSATVSYSNGNSALGEDYIFESL